MTLSAKRKMSQRQKRHRATRSTQTEDSGLNSLTNSPKNFGGRDLRDLGGQEGSSGGQGSEEDAPSSGNPTPQNSHDGEFYEEQAALYDRLVKAEEVSTTFVYLPELSFLSLPGLLFARTTFCLLAGTTFGQDYFWLLADTTFCLIAGTAWCLFAGTTFSRKSYD